MSSEPVTFDYSRGATVPVLDSSRSNATSADTRTAADLSSLLLELARLVRGIGFYSSRDSMRSELLDRAHRAWGSDLARSGVIELAIEADGFHAEGVADRIDAPHLGELARSMRERGIVHMRAEPHVAREAFEGLGLLLSDPARPEGSGDAIKPLAAIGLLLTRDPLIEGSATAPRPGSASAFFAPTPDPAGTQTNEPTGERTEDPSETQPIVEVPAFGLRSPRPYGVPGPASKPPARDRRKTRASLDARPDPRSAPIPLRDGPLEDSEMLDETSPLDAQGSGANAASRERATEQADPAEVATAPAAEPPGGWFSKREDADEDEDEDTTESTASLPAEDAVAQDADSEPGPDAPPRVESRLPAFHAERRLTARGDTPKRQLEEDPIAFPGDPRGNELREQLRALDTCRDLGSYRRHCERVVETTSGLLGSDLLVEGYRTALVLRRHAARSSGQTADIAEHAASALARVCSPALMLFAIERACSQDAVVGLHAAQILLAVGDSALPAIISFLRNGADPERIAQLAAVVISMGERAVEPVRNALDSAGGAPPRVVVQLAGELQNAKLVPSLVPLLHSDNVSLRKDASKALLLVGSASHEAFVDALASTTIDVARNAAHCLGKLGQRRAVRPLVNALERSLRRREEPLAREILRALGDIGEPRAVAPLVEVIQRSAWFRPRGRPETRLAAVAALERIPGGEADAALSKLASGRNKALAARARQAMARRKPSRSATPGVEGDAFPL